MVARHHLASPMSETSPSFSLSYTHTHSYSRLLLTRCCSVTARRYRFRALPGGSAALKRIDDALGDEPHAPARHPSAGDPGRHDERGHGGPGGRGVQRRRARRHHGAHLPDAGGAAGGDPALLCEDGAAVRGQPDAVAGHGAARLRGVRAGRHRRGCAHRRDGRQLARLCHIAAQARGNHDATQVHVDPARTVGRAAGRRLSQHQRLRVRRPRGRARHHQPDPTEPRASGPGRCPLHRLGRLRRRLRARGGAVPRRLRHQHGNALHVHRRGARAPAHQGAHRGRARDGHDAAAAALAQHHPPLQQRRGPRGPARRAREPDR